MNQFDIVVTLTCPSDWNKEKCREWVERLLLTPAEASNLKVVHWLGPRPTNVTWELKTPVPPVSIPISPTGKREPTSGYMLSYDPQAPLLLYDIRRVIREELAAARTQEPATTPIGPHEYRRPLRCDICGNAPQDAIHNMGAGPHRYLFGGTKVVDGATLYTCVYCTHPEKHAIHGYTGE